MAEQVWLNLDYSPVIGEDGAPAGVIAIVAETTQRILAELGVEAELAARTAERDQLWTLAEDMLARANYSGMMTAVNPAWSKILGFAEGELLSRPYSDFMHPDDVGVTVAALQLMGETKQPARFENRIKIFRW